MYKHVQKAEMFRLNEGSDLDAGMSTEVDSSEGNKDFCYLLIHKRLSTIFSQILIIS